MAKYTAYFTNGDTVSIEQKNLETAITRVAELHPTKELFSIRVGNQGDYIWHHELKKWIPNPIYYPMVKDFGKVYGNLCWGEDTQLGGDTILKAVDSKRIEELMPRITDGTSYAGGDTEMQIQLTDKAYDVIDMWMELYNAGLVDYVYVPIQYYYMLKYEYGVEPNNPFRLPKMYTDRISSFTKYLIK